MRAFNLAMGTIFFNAGIYITSLLGMFGNMGGVSNSFMSLFLTFSTPVITLPFNLPIIGQPVLRGIDLIAGALAASTVIFLSSNFVNDRGVGYSIFSIFFWGSFLMASASISSINFPGVSIIYMVYFLASTLIFIMALVQMPTGGQKTHV